MTTLRDHLAGIAAGPSGPQVGAFFDLDGTLVAGYTATTFFTEQLRHGDVPVTEALRTLTAAVEGAYLGGDPTAGALQGFAALRGQSEDTMSDLGERLFVQKIAGTIRAEARELVRAHLRMGHTVAVASAATKYQIRPVADDLGITHILCTEIEVSNGLLTGEVVGKILWGAEKATAVRAFARHTRLDLTRSYAYGNGHEDIAFLSCVGNPAALNPHPLLREAAGRFGWSVLDLRDPGGADLVSVTRTVLALGGLNAGVVTGLAVGAVTGNRQRGINTGITLACEIALGLAGVRVQTIGAANLTRARPAIFVANHQSSLDPIITGYLLRRDFTVLAKKESAFDPRSLLGNLLLNPAFVDRGDSAQARATLDALVSRVQGGTSLLIFPEGTRAPTQVLGPFRKGAFHLAIQAGVPVVPIVLRNTGELMWRRSKVIGSGTVQVCVLDPVEGWAVDRLTDQVADLRARFTATLADWPTGGRSGRATDVTGRVD